MAAAAYLSKSVTASAWAITAHEAPRNANNLTTISWLILKRLIRAAQVSVVVERSA